MRIRIRDTEKKLQRNAFSAQLDSILVCYFSGKKGRKKGQESFAHGHVFQCSKAYVWGDKKKCINLQIIGFLQECLQKHPCNNGFLAITDKNLNLHYFAPLNV